MARVDLPEPTNSRSVAAIVLEIWKLSPTVPSCIEMRPLFSKRSTSTKELVSLTLGLVAARTVPPSSLRNRSEPGPKSLVSLVSNTPPA